MDYLSALRDQLNIYGSFSKGGQGGGSSYPNEESDDSDTGEVYHKSYVSDGLNKRDNLINATEDQLRMNKSGYYDIAIGEAPNPLDQNILLNTVIEEDLKQIANMLLKSMNMNFEHIDGHFKSCVLSICKNNKDKIQVSQDDLEKYTNLLNKEGLKCLRNCRISLNNFNIQTKNKNINDCEKMINNIFITYVWWQYKAKKQEEEQ
jgi:hypothetical protein